MCEEGIGGPPAMIAVRTAAPAAAAPLKDVRAAAGNPGRGGGAGAEASPRGAWPPASDSDDGGSTPSAGSAAPSSTSLSVAACDTPPAGAAAAATAAVEAAPAAPAPAPPAPAVAAPAAAPAAVSRPSASAYSACSYWDGRYAQRATHFDWFFSYSALRPLLRHAMTLPGMPALHVGCGNSDLSIGIGEDGTPVINTDISPVVISQMRVGAAAWPDGPARRNCSWEVADCRGMPQYADDSFGAVVDKGTLDAVLCSGTGLGDVRCYVSEMHRLLAPGGVFILISLGQPETRLSVLRAQPNKRRPSSADGAVGAPAPAGAASPPPPQPSTLASRVAALTAAAAETAAASPAALAGCAGAGRREVRWGRVMVYLLPKPSLYLQNEASLLGRQLPAAVASPSAVVGKDEPIAWLGPYEVGRELEDTLTSPQLDPRDYFYCYVLAKAGGGGRRASARAAGEDVAAAALAAARGAALASPPAVARAASVAGALCGGSGGGGARQAAPAAGFSPAGAAAARAPSGEVRVLRLE
ncbi:MAG: hypothetical protein J3K34DRAFT_517946 [Monoraphidium minutum]|nr:MAG: hypothetical protein J3K34DRAFT_517946 [Monoraphidium minutum]